MRLVGRPCHAGRGRACSPRYQSELEIDVKAFFRPLPNTLKAAPITVTSTPAISPYSRAVTPRRSDFRMATASFRFSSISDFLRFEVLWNGSGEHERKVFSEDIRGRPHSESTTKLLTRKFPIHRFCEVNDEKIVI